MQNLELELDYIGDFPRIMDYLYDHSLNTLVLSFFASKSPEEWTTKIKNEFIFDGVLAVIEHPFLIENPDLEQLGEEGIYRQGEDSMPDENRYFFLAGYGLALEVVAKSVRRKQPTIG
jgi:hypothetical protein